MHEQQHVDTISAVIKSLGLTGDAGDAIAGVCGRSFEVGPGPVSNKCALLVGNMWLDGVPNLGIPSGFSFTR